MSIFSKISKKVTLSNLIKFSFFIDVIYIISKMVLLKFEIVYRQGFIDLIYINNFILIIMIAINLKKHFNKILKPKRGIFISLIVIIVGLWNVFFIYAFSQNSEEKIYKEGKLVIASVDSFLLDTSVTYYEPINIFLMKESNIQRITYNGSYNCYEYNEMNKKFLETEYVELVDNIELLEMTPMNAKKKFSKDVFNYLGNYTYDFGDIIIRFNEIESGVEEILFKRNVVKANQENVIGKNIDNAQEDTKKVYKKTYTDEYGEIEFEWFLDDDGTRSVKVVDKFGNGNFLFIVDDSLNITSIKFSIDKNE